MSTENKVVMLEGLAWLTYNLIKENPGSTCLGLRRIINNSFKGWSRSFIERKLKDGVKLGYLVCEKMPGNELVHYYFLNKEFDGEVKPNIEKVADEIFFYLKDEESLSMKMLSAENASLFKTADRLTEESDRVLKEAALALLGLEILRKKRFIEIIAREKDVRCKRN